MSDYRKSASEIGDTVLAAVRESDRKLGLDKKAFDYIGDKARQALLAHNQEELGDAGRVIGGVGGTLGGAALGAGAGALAGKKYLGGRGRGAGLGALAGGVTGGVAGMLAGPGWGKSKAQEATSRDVDQLNSLADQQYKQQLAQQQAQQDALIQQVWQSQQRQPQGQPTFGVPGSATPDEQAALNYLNNTYQGAYAPHEQQKQSSHIDKMAEAEAVPVPEGKDTHVKTPPSRNNFFAPHITGDYGHQNMGVEHALQRTPALPQDGVTDTIPIVEG